MDHFSKTVIGVIVAIFVCIMITACGNSQQPVETSEEQTEPIEDSWMLNSVQDISGEDPDLVTVMLGTNDLLSGLSADEITERMERFLDSISSAGKPVLLISPPVLQYGEWVLDDEIVEESESLGEKYRELAAREGYHFADAGKWNIDMTFDGVHFSPEGHAEFARQLEETRRSTGLLANTR